MKKRKYFLRTGITFLGVLVAMFLTNSCSDENIDPDVNSEILLTDDISLKSDRVAFSSIEAYENFLGNQDFDKRAALKSQLNKNTLFTSLSTSAYNIQSIPNGRVTTLEENGNVDLQGTILADLLNKDGIIEIGDYLFKVDMQHERVLVLHKDNEEKSYEDLLDVNTGNEDILVYSTDDDVLNMIMNDISPNEDVSMQASQRRRWRLFCREKGASRETDKDFANYGSDRRLDCKVVYQKAGIYFSLQSKVKSQKKIAGIWVSAGLEGSNQSIEYYVRYKPKCRSEQVKSGVKYSESNDDNELNHRAYESTRGLHKYQFRATFANHYWNVGTTIFEIKHGY